MSIVITKAWTQRGWDRDDHLIDDSRLREVIGRTYATVEHARRAVVARRDRRGPASFEFARGGRRYRYDTTARWDVPGRQVPLIEDITAEGQS